MEYEFACENVMQDCPGTVRGESEDEVLKAASDHARDVHGMETLSNDVVDQVRAAIVPVP